MADHPITDFRTLLPEFPRTLFVLAAWRACDRPCSHVRLVRSGNQVLVPFRSLRSLSKVGAGLLFMIRYQPSSAHLNQAVSRYQDGSTGGGTQCRRSPHFIITDIFGTALLPVRMRSPQTQMRTLLPRAMLNRLSQPILSRTSASSGPSTPTSTQATAPVSQSTASDQHTVDVKA